MSSILQQLHLGMVGSAAAAFFLRHYGPKILAWIRGEGVDEALAKALPRLKALLAQAGASPDEIKSLESIVEAVAARAAQDLDQDVKSHPGASSQ